MIKRTNILNAVAVVAAIGVFAVLGAGSANAGVLTNLTIWNALTPGSNIGSSNQLGSPSNPLFTPADLLANGAASGPINLTAALPTIGSFLTSGPITFAACGAGCDATTISQAGFAQVSLMRFTLAVSSTSTFFVNHDDGVSLFAAGTTATDLFNVADALPTSLATTETVTLAPGSYDLWYAEANGLPAILQEHETPVPEPASLALLGSALVGLGLYRRRRNRA